MMPEMSQEKSISEIRALLKTVSHVAKLALTHTPEADRPALAAQIGVHVMDIALALFVVHGGFCARHVGEAISIRLVKSGLGAVMEEDCGEHGPSSVN